MRESRRSLSREKAVTAKAGALGVSLRLATGESWHSGLGVADPAALVRALQAAGGAASQQSRPEPAWAYVDARASVRGGRLDRPVAKFILLPLVLAIPAFQLHQHIAYGSAFGEFYTFGLVAYLKGFALWWAAWSIGVVLFAAVLRAAHRGRDARRAARAAWGRVERAARNGAAREGRSLSRLARVAAAPAAGFVRPEQAAALTGGCR